MQAGKFHYIAIILLIILAIAMIVIGINGGMLPPTLTGVGFLLIAFIIANKK